MSLLFIGTMAICWYQQDTPIIHNDIVPTFKIQTITSDRHYNLKDLHTNESTINDIINDIIDEIVALENDISETTHNDDYIDIPKVLSPTKVSWNAWLMNKIK
jgi:hypothetical protein